MMSEQLLWPKMAFRLGAIFVAGFLVVLSFAIYENGRREKLERVEFRTVAE